MPDNKFKVGDKVRITKQDNDVSFEIGDTREVLKVSGSCVLLAVTDGWWDDELNQNVWWMSFDEVEPFISANELPPKFAVTFRDDYETIVSFFDTIEGTEGFALSLNPDTYRDITILQRIGKVETKPFLVR